MYVHYVTSKNYWDINEQIRSTMTPFTRAAADAPIRCSPAAIPNDWVSQHLSQHAWPSVDGLVVALVRLWVRMDGAAAAATLARLPRQDVRRVRLVVLLLH